MEKFFAYLDKLRRMPDARKRTFSFGGALAITAVIFGIWVNATFTSIPHVQLPSSDSERLSVRNENEASPVSVSPFGTVKETIMGTIAEIKRQFAGLGELGKIEIQNIIAADASSSTTTLTDIRHYEIKGD